MWAGCIWVPIYEVMTRKHLKLVTLEENLEMAADIGIDATTSLDEAFAEAMERHGPDAKVIVLPFARYQLPRNMVRMDAEPLRFPQEATRARLSDTGTCMTQQRVIGLDAHGTAPEPPPTREIKGSTTIVELLRMYPDGEAARLMSALTLPCAHCGGAFHEPLTHGRQAAPPRSARSARGVSRARRAAARPPAQVEAAARRVPTQ